MEYRTDLAAMHIVCPENDCLRNGGMLHEFLAGIHA